MSAHTRATVIVVTWRGASHIEDCLDSLLAQREPADILVLDNASDDGTEAILRRYAERHPSIRVRRTARNLGFAGGVAAALEDVDAEFAALLNDDAAADAGWLAALLANLERDPRAAAATSQLRLSASGRMNNAGVALSPAGYGYDIGLGDPPADHMAPAEVFGFCGGAALLRTAAVREIGGFPADFFLYYEDTDTSWRLRLAGWTIAYEPAALVHHQHSATAGRDRRSFAWHNERNRLWMLIRCAPAGVAVTQCARFALTTASLALQTVRRRRPPGEHFSPRLRLAVLGATAGRLPTLLRQRRAVGATRLTRRRVWQEAQRLSGG